MNPSIVLLLCSFLLLSASSVSALNVTKILGEYPNYSTFNELLSKTGLASVINTRGTITLLAIPNGAIGDLTSKPDDVLRRILATHVVLDYYDPMKLQNMKGKTAKLTTMYQQSGKAAYDQGFLNVTAKDGSFVFGSAVKGAQRDSRLEKSVMNQPYNISILGISQPIVTPGIDGTLVPVSAPPPEEKAPASPKSSPAAESPSEEEEAQSPSEEEAQSPSEEETEAPAPSPAANSPAADSPDADSPDADSPPADAQSPPTSSAGKLKVSLGFFVVLASLAAAY